MTQTNNPKARDRAGRWAWAISGLLAGVSSSAVAANPTADVVYQHGIVYTVDQAGTVAQGLAIAQAARSCPG